MDRGSKTWSRAEAVALWVYQTPRSMLSFCLWIWLLLPYNESFNYHRLKAGGWDRPKVKSILDSSGYSCVASGNVNRSSSNIS